MNDRMFWLIGDWRGSAFAEVRDWLAKQGRCRRVESVEAAANLKKPGAPPAALVHAQTWPGQVAAEAMEQLAQAFPVSKLIVLNGPWCEGEHRSVRPIAGAVRLPWRRWRVGLEEALEDTVAAVCAPVAEFGHPERVPARAAVWAFRRASFSYLADALAELRLEPVWLGGSGCHTAAADVHFYDGWEYVMPIPVARRARRTVGTPARIVAQHFPRPDDALAAAAWGIDAMLPQPFLVSDLERMLDRLLWRDTQRLTGDRR